MLIVLEIVVWLAGAYLGSLVFNWLLLYRDKDMRGYVKWGCALWLAYGGSILVVKLHRRGKGKQDAIIRRMHLPEAQRQPRVPRRP